MIKGESYPEDVTEFYGPLIDKLRAHLGGRVDAKIDFTFQFIYFNSSSAKVLIGLFEMLDAAAESSNDVTINWVHEEDDDNMEEIGEEFAEDLEHATFQLRVLEG